MMFYNVAVQSDKIRILSNTVFMSLREVLTHSVIGKVQIINASIIIQLAALILMLSPYNM